MKHRNSRIVAREAEANFIRAIKGTCGSCFEIDLLMRGRMLTGLDPRAEEGMNEHLNKCPSCFAMVVDRSMGLGFPVKM